MSRQNTCLAETLTTGTVKKEWVTEMLNVSKTQVKHDHDRELPCFCIKLFFVTVTYRERFLIIPPNLEKYTYIVYLKHSPIVLWADPTHTIWAASLAESQKYSVSIYVQILHKGRNVTNKLGVSPCSADVCGCVRAVRSGGGTDQGHAGSLLPAAPQGARPQFSLILFSWHVPRPTRHHDVCGASLSYLSTLPWCLWGSDTQWERWERDVAHPGSIR